MTNLATRLPAPPRLRRIFGALGALALAAPLLAHGGQYRGPGDVKPGGPGVNANGQGGNTGSSGPTTDPGKAQRDTVNPNPSCHRGGGAAAGAPGAPRGMQLGDDLTRWEFWWEFGKDPFLQLRETVQSGRVIAPEDALLNPRLAARAQHVDAPTAADRTVVADRIVQLLRRGAGRDTTSAALIALAKIGSDGDTWRLRDELLPFLARGDQELRETAALALGIAGQVDADTIGTLTALVRAAGNGRKLSGDRSVNERTRAFAAFGLGLLLQKGRDAGLARRIVDALLPVVASDRQSRDLRVAAIEALSQFPRDWDAAAPRVLRGAIVDALMAYYDRRMGPGEELLQAHVPPAIAKLLPANDSRTGALRARFATDLQRQMSGSSQGKTNPHIAQSCALALGPLTPAWEHEDDQGAETAALLLRTFRRHKDHQARRFAIMALGRLGGAETRKALLTEFDRSNKALERPWVAMALAVLELPARRSAGPDYDPDGEITHRLRASLTEVRTPSAQAAIALALGLVGDTGAADAMRKLLRKKGHQSDVAGYLCIALGLLRDDLSTGEIRAVMRASARQSTIVFHCTQALGLLGDPNVVGDLCGELTLDEPSLARLAAAASALGQIGDRRSLPALLQLVDRDDVTPLARAFAVVGLGSVCDKDNLPWNAAYATDCNYRASTSTLTDGAAGILDIL
ncbi:MAG: hypothetical protein NXI31_18590 [bacterium]|nr:hypothetical protein [bacterium]